MVSNGGNSSVRSALDNAVRRAVRRARWPRSEGFNAIVVLGSLTVASGAVWAQSTDQGQSTNQAQSADQALQEVVVTATRRATNVIDIPYNISAVSDVTLTDNHITDISDLTNVVAGLSNVDTGPGNAGRNNNFSLRGITADSTDNNGGTPAATVSPVSIYIGETPLYIPLQLDDMDRVEVLRGPQGTLYGSGSLAGTIRFIPKGPDPSGFSARLTGDVAALPGHGSDWNRSANGFVNIPLGDTAALRISGGYNYYAGFISLPNLVEFGPASTAINSPIGIPTASDPANPNSGFVQRPVEQNANFAEVSHVRTAFLWKPVQAFSLEASWYHQGDFVANPQQKTVGFNGGVTDSLPAAINPFSPNDFGPVNYSTGGTVFRPAPGYSLSAYADQPTSRNTDLFALDLQFDLGFATLSSSTSHYKDAQYPILDVSAGIAGAFGAFYGFIPRLADIDYTRNNLKGTVEELRLVSNGIHRFDYVVGAFYQNVKTDDWTTQYLPGQTFWAEHSATAADANPQIGDINFITNNVTNFDDRAIFGELTWHVTDKWQFTGGGRQFWQDFSVHTFSQLPYCGIFCGIDAAGDTIVDGASSVNNHIFKLNTSYAFVPRQMVYATFSEGFRRGGANGIPLSGPFAASPALLLYQPDETRNYEVGIKGRALGQAYSAAVYYIDWDNVQIDASAAAGGYGLVANGSRAQSKGVELEMSGVLLRGLNYNLSYAYTDATIADSFQIFDNFFGTPAAIVSTAAGNPLPNSPKNSASLSLSYEQSLQNLPGWGLQWHVNGTYRSDAQSALVSLVPGNPQPFTIEGFQVWNASLTLHSESHFSTMLYVNNIFDNQEITGGSIAARSGPRGKFFFVGKPLTVGLQINYYFGKL